MKLKELVSTIQMKTIDGDEEIPIAGIESHSRRIVPNMLFAAVKGTTVDGHDYIDVAIEKGATAILCQHIPEKTKHMACTFVVVQDTAKALGIILDTWYGHPSSRLTLVGVTGTNGKTTVATVLYDLFRHLGHKVGLLSTVCNYIDDKLLSATHTTPDPISLHRLIAQMAEAGCEYVFIEVSSHAIDQKRISGLHFKGGIFTNLSRDHLDYHKTIDNYLKTKKKFFDGLSENAFALTNIDDKTGSVMLQNTAACKLTYSLQTLADFKGKIVESHFEGTELIINDRELNVLFVGRFNAYNLLAVYGAAIALGESPEDVCIALSALHPVSGRFETVQSPKGLTAIVDYAHTPDALTNVLTSIHDILKGKGRIITVIGAGGNRDKGKRPLMAKEACRLSDLVILTSDNPRFEDPEEIIRDMMAGLNEKEQSSTLCILKRVFAIKTAVHLARKGDIVLIAGKGHEKYQEIKGIKRHFDDKEMLQFFLVKSY